MYPATPLRLAWPPQLINSSRNCVFASAALLEQLGDTLAFGPVKYVDKMARDALPAFDPDLVPRYLGTGTPSVWRA